MAQSDRLAEVASAESPAARSFKVKIGAAAMKVRLLVATRPVSESSGPRSTNSRCSVQRGVSRFRGTAPTKIRQVT